MLPYGKGCALQLHINWLIKPTLHKVATILNGEIWGSRYHLRL